MSTTIYESGEREVTKLDLFHMVEKLSCVHFAKICELGTSTTYVIFITRSGSEFVCSWSFNRVYFDCELKTLFTKHNSVWMTGKE